MSAGHGHVDTPNKKVALLVTLLAAMLAISEMAGKSSQTHALADHIDASNLWSFFQAKTIRQTTMRTAAEGADAQFKDNPTAMPPALKAQSEQWRRTAQRQGQGGGSRSLPRRLSHVRVCLGVLSARHRPGRRRSPNRRGLAHVHFRRPGRRGHRLHPAGLPGAHAHPHLGTTKNTRGVMPSGVVSVRSGAAVSRAGLPAG